MIWHGFSGLWDDVNNDEWPGKHLRWQFYLNGANTTRPFGRFVTFFEKFFMEDEIRNETVM